MQADPQIWFSVQQKFTEEVFLKFFQSSQENNCAGVSF